MSPGSYVCGVRVPPLGRGGQTLWLPVAVLVVSLVSLSLVVVVRGPSTGPVVLAVGFGPTAGGAVFAGYRNLIRSLPLLGLVPTLTLFALTVDQSLRFGGVGEMIWLVSVVVFVLGVVAVGYGLGRVLASLRAWTTACD